MSRNKAIKKHKKSFHRFLLLMSFIFFVLLLFLQVFEVHNIYIVLYFILIELIIVTAVLLRVDSEYLSFQNENYKIIIKNRIISEKINLQCDKVLLVHAFLDEKDWSILIITKTKSRDKNFRLINNSFFQKYPEVDKFYNEIIHQQSDGPLYYLIIKNPSIKKYELLDLIYKNCVSGVFTVKAIDQISKYRN